VTYTNQLTQNTLNLDLTKEDHMFRQEAREWLNRNLPVVASSQELGCGQSVEYMKNRRPFEQQIGAFQVVKHRCADMAVRCESAWSLTCYGAAAYDAGLPSAVLNASSAKVMAAQDAIKKSSDNVQNHGAMGFTYELAAHPLLRRAHSQGDTLIEGTELLDLLRRN